MTESVRLVRKPVLKKGGAILFRGVMTPVRVEGKARRKGTNKVLDKDGHLKIILGMQ
jgi:hypothetical protein